jgi:hypothetical protein
VRNDESVKDSEDQLHEELVFQDRTRAKREWLIEHMEKN